MRFGTPALNPQCPSGPCYNATSSAGGLPMLMVLDVGNTNTVLGVYREDELLNHWRLATERERTADEYGILIRTLFSLGEISNGTVKAVVISSVVPPIRPALEEMALRYFGVQPLF